MIMKKFDDLEMSPDFSSHTFDTHREAILRIMDSWHLKQSGFDEDFIQAQVLLVDLLFNMVLNCETVEEILGKVKKIHNQT